MWMSCGGAAKRRESFWGVLSGFKLIRQRYGRVDLNIGKPLILEAWRQSRPSDDPQAAAALGREVLERVNRAASVNPVNLAAMTLLCAPRSAMETERLQEQIDCCLDLLRRHSAPARLAHYRHERRRNHRLPRAVGHVGSGTGEFRRNRRRQSQSRRAPDVVSQQCGPCAGAALLHRLP